MIRVTNKSDNFSFNKVKKSYVRYERVSDSFVFCQTTFDHPYDIRQGVILDDSIIPQSIQDKARAISGTWPSYVEIDNKIMEIE